MVDKINKNYYNMWTICINSIVTANMPNGYLQMLH